MSTISIIGAGAWGTALAQIYATAGHSVTLWAREESLATLLRDTRVNTPYLPDYTLHDDVFVTNNLSEAFTRSDIILNVIPAQFVRHHLSNFLPFIKQHHHFVLCAKGIEIETGLLLSAVVRSVLPDTPISILSGPTFAHDLMAGCPSAATLASDHQDSLEYLWAGLSSAQFRLYKSHDIIGAQVGGAIKNVIGIACGMSDGLNLGASARAAVFTRGLAEMRRLTVALGGQSETIMGQCGVGDLMATCSSPQSRNYSFGFRMGRGEPAEAILKDRRSVVEGVSTAKAIVRMSTNLAIEMPIAHTVHDCITGALKHTDLMAHILSRPLKDERD